MDHSANIRKRRLIANYDRLYPPNDDEPGPSFMKQKCYPNSISLLKSPTRSTPSTAPLAARLPPKKRIAARLAKIKDLVARSILSQRNQPENEKGFPKNLIDLNKFKHDPNKARTLDRTIQTIDLTKESNLKKPNRLGIPLIRLVKFKQVIAKTRVSKQHLPEWKQKKAFNTLHRIAIEQYFHEDMDVKNQFLKRCHSRVDDLIGKRLEYYSRQQEGERCPPVVVHQSKPEPEPESEPIPIPKPEEPLYDSYDDGCPIEGALLNESRLNTSSELFDAILNKKSSPKPNLRPRQKPTPNSTKSPSPPKKNEPTSPSPSSESDTELYPFTDVANLDFVTIGPNGTKIRSKDYCKIQWDKPAHVIAKRFSVLVFGNKMLATHTVPNMNSPPKSGQKNILDSAKLKDIVRMVTTRKKDASEKSIYGAIKAKCLHRRTCEKKRQMKEFNVSP